MVRMDRRLWLLFALAVAAPLTVVWALKTGSLATDWTTLWQILGGAGDTATGTVIRELRAPRALSAFAVGGLLALSGALLQVLLRNPLADPYVLGISGGAGTAALAAMLAGAGGGLVAGSALAGALLTTLLVFGLSHSGGPASSQRLLLTGVVTASGFGALISLILTLAPGAQVQGMLYWLLGDLARATHPGAGLIVLAIGLLAAQRLAGTLNVLARGENVAATLGIDPLRMRWGVYFLTSALAATAVVLAGAVGFVGLVVPHMLRRLGLADHRYLLPAAVLLGGGFLVVADTLARSLAAPTQLPVGVLTALLGVPAFLYLLARGSRP
jgi:iron complex transport system permease protein